MVNTVFRYLRVLAHMTGRIHSTWTRWLVSLRWGINLNDVHLFLLQVEDENGQH